MKNQIQPTKEGAMRRRIVIALALIAVLVVGSSMIGGTLAYLSTYTPKIENVFELGKLKYKLHYEKGVSDELADTVTNMPDHNPAEGEIAGTEYTFESDAPVRTGYKFLGWADEPNVTEAEYLWDDEKQKYLVTVEYDPANYEDGTTTKTVYAVWEQMDLTVTFDTQVEGLTVNPASKTVTYQLPYGELPTPERPGYTFLGWTLEADDDDLTTKVTAASIVETAADHTLYAQWGAKSYIIRYHANGGEGEMENQIIKYDIPTTLRKNTFTKDDHQFGGWALASDSEIAEYIDEQIVVNLLEEGYLDLYAIWIQESHTVFFNYNGGSGSPDSKQVQNGKPYGVLPTYPTKYHHLFAGWYTAAEGGTRVYPDTNVNSTVDHTLYAQWIYSPANEIIQDLVIKNNPDDNFDGVVDDIYLNFACSSYFEKFNVPLENLIEGQTYKLSFTESNDATFGTNENGYGGAIYGSIITVNGTLDKGSIKEESEADGGLIAVFDDQFTKGNDWLNGPRDWEMIFTAEAETMYWTWDMGLIQDGPKRNYNFRDIVLEPVAPTIEFANKKLKIYETSKAQILNDNSSAYATNFVFDGDGYAETMYYPITGLTAGSTYTIVVDHKYTGVLIDSTKYDYGFGIMDAAPTSYGSFMENITGTDKKWISNTFVMPSVTGDTESVTLTFTATGSTAYWVWNMANVSDGTNATIDVRVTSFSANHNGKSITYYTAPSQANAIGYTMTPPVFEPITVDMPGITVTGMETYATDQPLVLTISGDADMLPDLVLVNVLVGENWTFYATGLDKDLLTSYAAADGVTIAQPDWLVKNEDGSWTLTIPGEVVVSDVTIVISGANFRSYDLYDMTIDDLSN